MRNVKDIPPEENKNNNPIPPAENGIGKDSSLENTSNESMSKINNSSEDMNLDKESDNQKISDINVKEVINEGNVSKKEDAQNDNHESSSNGTLSDIDVKNTNEGEINLLGESVFSKDIETGADEITEDSEEKNFWEKHDGTLESQKNDITISENLNEIPLTIGEAGDKNVQVQNPEPTLIESSNNVDIIPEKDIKNKKKSKKKNKKDLADKSDEQEDNLKKENNNEIEVKEVSKKSNNLKVDENSNIDSKDKKDEVENTKNNKDNEAKQGKENKVKKEAKNKEKRIKKETSEKKPKVKKEKRKIFNRKTDNSENETNIIPEIINNTDIKITENETVTAEDKKTKINKEKLKKVITIVSIVLGCIVFVLVVSFGVYSVLPANPKYAVKTQVNYFFGNYRAAEQAALESLDIEGANVEKINQRLINIYTKWLERVKYYESYNEDSLYLVDKLLEKEPENKDNIFIKVKILMKLEYYEDAQILCRELLAMDEGNLDYNLSYLEICQKLEDTKGQVETYTEIYKITGDEKYLIRGNNLRPFAPVFSSQGGNFDSWFVLRITKQDPGCVIMFTLDGKAPDVEAALTSSPVSSSRTYIYQDGLNFEYYATGKDMLVRAVVVDPATGVKSAETADIFRFDVPYRPVEGMTLSRDYIDMTEGDMYLLRADFYPENATNKNVIWSSSDPNYVTVDERGTLSVSAFSYSEEVEIRKAFDKEITITATVVGTDIVAYCTIKVNPEAILATDDIARRKGFKYFDLLPTKNINPRTVGWVYMESSDDFLNMPNDPVLQYKAADVPEGETFDRWYYLKHDIDDNSSKSGALFADPTCDMEILGKNTIIYGSIKTSNLSRKNATVTERGTGDLFTMIATLDDYPRWYLDANNHFVYFSTAYANYTCEVFSWYKPEKKDTSYDRVDFNSNSQFTNFAKAVQDKNQMYNLKQYSFSAGDHIITFVVFDEKGNVDTVMHAKIEKSEALFKDKQILIGTLY